MTRIVILGCAGSGKSRLAARLGALIGARVVSLDALWRAFAPERDIEGFRRTVERAHAASSWISDGNFADVTFDLRLRDAQLVVWVDRPRILCALRSIKRLFGRNPAHRLRELITVFSFIESFDRAGRPMIEAMRRKHGKDIPVVHLETDQECEEFLARFATGGTDEVRDARPRALPLSPAA